MENVYVIGAGLSGLYAAKSAAANGSNVTVFEKNCKIGEVLKCGEMFTTIYGMPPSVCVTNEIENWSFIFNNDEEPDKMPINIGLPEGFALMTDRSMHERSLYEDCDDLGVKFRFLRDVDNIIDSLGDKYDPETSAIIVACGVSGCKENVEKAHAVCATSRTYHYDNVKTAFFMMLKGNAGYKWIFPKRNGEINVGYGYDKKPNEKLSLSSVFNDKDIFGNILKKGGGAIPINTDFMDVHNYIVPGIYNAIKVGDAACLVNPMLMGGEHLAMISGIVAGYVSATWKYGDTLKFYEMRKNVHVNDFQHTYYKAITEIIAPEMNVGIMVNNMRKCMTVSEFHSFFKEFVTNSSISPFNDIMLSYIKRNMSKHMKAPETTENEIKELI